MPARPSEPPSPERTPPLPDARLLWDAITSSIDGFVSVIDRDLRLRFLNHSDVGHAAAEKILGLPLTEFLVPEDRDRVQRILTEVFTTGQAAAYEAAAANQHGEVVSYSVRASPVIEREQVVAVVATAIDARLLHDTEQALRNERQALQQMLRTQERERQLVSYEIHDGLAQYQAGAIMQLEACLHSMQSRRDPGLDDVIRSCTEGLRLMRAAAAEARRLINGLRPPMLDELGIEEAVESLVERMHDVVPVIRYLHPEPLRRLDPDVETAIFRIVQESLSNIRKHATARSVEIVLGPRGDTDVAVRVADDGIGFDVRRVPEGRFGLEGIRQRARLFGREATISSAPGKGTVIDVVLPLFPAMVRGDGRGPGDAGSQRAAR